MLNKTNIIYNKEIPYIYNEYEVRQLINSFIYCICKKSNSIHEKIIILDKNIISYSYDNIDANIVNKQFSEIICDLYNFEIDYYKYKNFIINRKYMFNTDSWRNFIEVSFNFIDVFYR